MKSQEAHTAKKGEQLHIVAGGAGCREQHWQPSLRYHQKTTSNVLHLKEIVLGAQGQKPLLWPVWFESLGDNLGKLLQQALQPCLDHSVSLACITIVHLEDRTQYLVSSQKCEQDHYWYSNFLITLTSLNKSNIYVHISSVEG